MDGKEFDNMMNDVKNAFTKMGKEVTSTSGTSLALDLGKCVYTNDNFKHANLSEIMQAIISFTCSYFNDRDDFMSLTQQQRKTFISKFLFAFTDVFYITEELSTKINKEQLAKRVKDSSCQHKGFLIHYVLNEEYWYCTNCHVKIKKKGYNL